MIDRLAAARGRPLNNSLGFSLVELMATLSVVTILLTLGAPSLQTMIENNRIATQTNELLAAIHLARSESVKTGRRVVLCKSSDLASCAASGGYEQGWVVFVDADNDAAVDAGERILRVHGPLSGNHSVTGATDVASYIAFSSDGFARRTNGALQSGTLTLDLCSNRSEKNSIVIKPTGRTGVEKVSCSG